jgi:hypothetical protein
MNRGSSAVWRNRAEEYRICGEAARSADGRMSYLAIAEQCEQYAALLEHAEDWQRKFEGGTSAPVLTGQAAGPGGQTHVPFYAVIPNRTAVHNLKGEDEPSLSAAAALWFGLAVAAALIFIFT